ERHEFLPRLDSGEPPRYRGLLERTTVGRPYGGRISPAWDLGLALHPWAHAEMHSATVGVAIRNSPSAIVPKRKASARGTGRAGLEYAPLVDTLKPTANVFAV